MNLGDIVYCWTRHRDTNLGFRTIDFKHHEAVASSVSFPRCIGILVDGPRSAPFQEKSNFQEPKVLIWQVLTSAGPVWLSEPYINDGKQSACLWPNAFDSSSQFVIHDPGSLHYQPTLRIRLSCQR